MISLLLNVLPEEFLKLRSFISTSYMLYNIIICIQCTTYYYNAMRLFLFTIYISMIASFITPASVSMNARFVEFIFLRYGLNLRDSSSSSHVLA